MRKWSNPVIEEVNLSQTANGGTPSMDFDQKWYDQNGALHVNFVDKNAPEEQNS